jgi:hypothetical protein
MFPFRRPPAAERGLYRNELRSIKATDTAELENGRKKENRNHLPPQKYLLLVHDLFFGNCPSLSRDGPLPPVVGVTL